MVKGGGEDEEVEGTGVLLFHHPYAINLKLCTDFINILLQLMTSYRVKLQIYMVERAAELGKIVAPSPDEIAQKYQNMITADEWRTSSLQLNADPSW